MQIFLLIIDKTLKFGILPIFSNKILILSVALLKWISKYSRLSNLLVESLENKGKSLTKWILSISNVKLFKEENDFIGIYKIFSKPKELILIFVIDEIALFS